MDGAPRHHGGPDAAGAAPWDLSTCANAAGPCPAALAALREVDPTRYPDPRHTELRQRLGALHGVAPERIVIAASASEFIQRVTAVAARLGVGSVLVPAPGYGDYAAAATACGLPVDASTTGVALTDGLALRWIADPSSPLGQDTAPAADGLPTVLDAAYAPLRLAGKSPWRPEDLDRVFVLMSPNKALGLTGVRGAYAIAPSEAWPGQRRWRQALAAAEPSWPLGAHGVAMLQAWCEPGVAQWVRHSHTVLAAWKRELITVLQARGFEVRPSVTPFVVVRPPRPFEAERLRRHGVAVRDAASFGLPGCWRASAQPPAALRALARALDAEGLENLR
jgi:histidinol-phosphate aminotransferase